MMTRRDVIGTAGGGVALAALASSGTAWAAGVRQPPFRALCDCRLDGGRKLHAAALRLGGEVADPAGEMVRLFVREGSWLDSDVAIVGYSGWADYHMMGELARAAGKSIARAVLNPGKGDGLVTGRELVSCVARKGGESLDGILDFAARQCRQGGVAWIVQP